MNKNKADRYSLSFNPLYIHCDVMYLLNAATNSED